MFDCYDTTHAVLQVATGVMSTLKVRNVFVVKELKKKRNAELLLKIMNLRNSDLIREVCLFPRVVDQPECDGSGAQS